MTDEKIEEKNVEMMKLADLEYIGDNNITEYFMIVKWEKKQSQYGDVYYLYEKKWDENRPQRVIVVTGQSTAQLDLLPLDKIDSFYIIFHQYYIAKYNAYGYSVDHVTLFKKVNNQIKTLELDMKIDESDNQIIENTEGSNPFIEEFKKSLKIKIENLEQADKKQLNKLFNYVIRKSDRRQISLAIFVNSGLLDYRITYDSEIRVGDNTFTGVSEVSHWMFDIPIKMVDRIEIRQISGD
ncbi:MAG: hypothetical protein QXU18_13005 [Thermoplasmatales archaeon]